MRLGWFEAVKTSGFYYRINSNNSFSRNSPSGSDGWGGGMGGGCSQSMPI